MFKIGDKIEVTSKSKLGLDTRCGIVSRVERDIVTYSPNFSKDNASGYGAFNPNKLGSNTLFGVVKVEIKNQQEIINDAST